MPAEHLDENLGSCEAWPKRTIHHASDPRYLSEVLQAPLATYKRRPIYCSLPRASSGFQALVYLAPHHEGTLSRMRTSIVIPLQGKIAGRIEQWSRQAEGTFKLAFKGRSKRNSLAPKQQKELAEYDDKLRHYADLRSASISIDGGEGRTTRSSMTPKSRFSRSEGCLRKEPRRLESESKSDGSWRPNQQRPPRKLRALQSVQVKEQLLSSEKDSTLNAKADEVPRARMFRFNF